MEMKIVAVVSTLLLLVTGCGGAPTAPAGSTGPAAAVGTAPSDPNAPTGNPPADPGTPPAGPTGPGAPPSDPGTPAGPSGATGAPAPGPLSCYVNALQVYCTGANILTGMVQLDTDTMFNPYIVDALSVTNDIVANVQGVVCSQPNPLACSGGLSGNFYAHSVCVHATLHIFGVAGSQFQSTLCGDAVDEVNQVFEEQ